MRCALFLAVTAVASITAWRYVATQQSMPAWAVAHHIPPALYDLWPLGWIFVLVGVVYVAEKMGWTK